MTVIVHITNISLITIGIMKLLNNYSLAVHLIWNTINYRKQHL